jgi:hypothetical protein
MLSSREWKIGDLFPSPPPAVDPGGVVAGGQAQARGVPIWGSGEEEAHQSSAVHGSECQPTWLIRGGVRAASGHADEQRCAQAKPQAASVWLGCRQRRPAPERGPQ